MLDLRLLVTDLAAGETKRYERTVEMNLQSRVPRLETSAWYPLSQPFELLPGRYQARLVVRDRNSGRLGSLTHDFDVPVRKGMTLSSLIVTDTVEMPAQGSEGPPETRIDCPAASHCRCDAVLSVFCIRCGPHAEWRDARQGRPCCSPRRRHAS